jgi:hypothetical protein
MAITFTVVPKRSIAVGDSREIIADLTTSGTVTSGGDALTAGQQAQLGISGGFLGLVEIMPGNGATSLVASYDYTNNKVRFYTASGTPGATANLVEAVGATPVGTFRMRVLSKGSAAAGAPAT